MKSCGAPEQIFAFKAPIVIIWVTSLTNVLWEGLLNWESGNTPPAVGLQDTEEFWWGDMDAPQQNKFALMAMVVQKTKILIWLLDMCQKCWRTGWQTPGGADDNEDGMVRGQNFQGEWPQGTAALQGWAGLTTRGSWPLLGYLDMTVTSHSD